MAAQQLSLETVSAVDAGEVARAWNIAVERAIRDCQDRPANPKVRKVVLQVEFMPASGEDGAVDDLDVNFLVQERFPAIMTGVITMRVRKRGQQLVLAFDGEPGGAEES
jgi:hypothetical protein